MKKKISQKKVIIITGASSGMGKKTAMALIEQGCKVYAGARRLDKMRDLVDLGGLAFAVDVSKDRDLTGFVDNVVKAEGGIDVLINNAGFGLYGTVEDTSLAEARYQFEVNLFGLARLTQLVLPHMRVQRSGRIVNLSSVGGKIYTPLGAWYHATKHAVEGFSDCLRLEVKPFGIDVVIIEPGLIDTNFTHIVSKYAQKNIAESAYKNLITALTETIRNPGKRLPKTDPAVLAQVIARAATEPNPQTRYVKGAMAKSLLFVRKWFSDKFFDKLIVSKI